MGWGTLKRCAFVETEYKQVLESVKSRRLSLWLAVTRVTEMYDSLKCYFKSHDKCPNCWNYEMTNFLDIIIYPW
jgi:hypothetical protein